MSLKYWEINGQHFAFDNQDAECMKRYEDAFDAMLEESNALPKDGNVIKLRKNKIVTGIRNEPVTIFMNIM